MTVELNTSNLIFISTALLAAFWGLLKLLAAQHERSLDKRFLELGAIIAANQDLTRKLEQDFMVLQGDITRNYLRRDDYLREMQGIRQSLTRIEDFLLKNAK